MTSWREGLARRIPAVQFGSGTPGQASPVTTYYLVVVPVLVLAAIGLVMGFSASAVSNIALDHNPYVAFGRPAGIVLFSLLVAALLQFVPERVWYVACPGMFVAALVFQSLVLTPLGANEGGNTNWVHLPGVSLLIQPSEFLKLAMVLFLARAVTRPGAQVDKPSQMLVTAGGVVALSGGAVLLGHDLGTALVVIAAAVGVLWVAGLPGRWFAVLLGASAPVLAFLVVSNPTRLKRILAVLPGHDPGRDLAAPEQIDHALWALGSGGLTGLGPGASREKWNYLQAAHTDFILAIIGEEFGLLGTLTVLVCLGLAVWGMIRVAEHHSSLFARVVAAGVATWIGVQGLMNIASVTGIGPVIGVPLPLVSYGGSSFLFTASAVAVVASLARGDAGMRLAGRPDEASAGRDPRRAPRRRRARRAEQNPRPREVHQ